MTKYIFVTGGVVSSLGKGITAASLGVLLKRRGYKVSIIKMDPYINVDAGAMSPFQHGEVFVTWDGAAFHSRNDQWRKQLHDRKGLFRRHTARARRRIQRRDRPGHTAHNERNSGQDRARWQGQGHRHRRDRRNGRRHRRAALPRSDSPIREPRRAFQHSLLPRHARPLHRGLGRA